MFGLGLEEIARQRLARSQVAICGEILSFSGLQMSSIRAFISEKATKLDKTEGHLPFFETTQRNALPARAAT